MNRAPEARSVTITLTCDWRRGIAPPIQALKRILKLLGRTYHVKVMAHDLREHTEAMETTQCTRH